MIPVAGLAANETDAGPSLPGVYTGPQPEGSVGTFIARTPVTFADVMVGLENDGSGNLLYTDIGPDEIGSMTTAAALIGVEFATTDNPIGVTTDGTDIYVTNAVNQAVEIFDAAGSPIGSFPTAPDSTFPEGITFNPLTGNLYVVDGDGSDQILEYTTAGTLLSANPVGTTSTDGIAFDPLTCTYWVYASGQDSVTQYSPADYSVMTTFPGSGAQGSSNAEGLGVVGTTLYLMATGADELVSFDITGADSLCIDPDPIVEVPTLSWFGFLALFGLLAISAFWMMARRRRHA